MGYAQAATRVYQFVPDNVLQLSNAEFSRKISVGIGWQKIRLGFLATVTPNRVAQSINGPIFCRFGMSSSVGPGVSAYATQNFIGVNWIGQAAAGAGLTYTAGTWPNPYYVNAINGPQVFGKIGSTLTVAAADASAVAWAPTGVGNSRRFPYFLDITRPAGGNGTYTLTTYALVTAASLVVDYAPHHFFDGLDSVGTPVCNGITLNVTTNAKTISWGELTGPLDTITLYWSRFNFPLEITAIGAAVQDVVTYAVDVPSGFVEVWGAGTVAPFSNSDVYSYGTLLGGTLTPPIYGSGPIVMAGSSANLALYDTVSGTSTGPADNFESYAVGTVNSGSTLNAGLGWDGPGYVYQW